MIPTMILLGLLLGRWWKSALVVAAIAWPALILATGAIDVAQIPIAAAYGVANAAIGVGIHQGILRLIRRTRGHSVHTPRTRAS